MVYETKAEETDTNAGAGRIKVPSGRVHEHKPQHLPRSIWALGFVSLFMDTSSELVHSLLPALLVSVLGISMVGVGIIEGIAEATAAITKVFSGALSDRLGRRKGLTVVGYSLSAMTKLMFPLAQSAGMVFTARFLDRLGKGIRGAPRDALVADLTPSAVRGAAYGLRQALDTAGAFLGPLLAIVLMALFLNDVRLVLWFALLPAMICVALLVFAVKEPERKTRQMPSAKKDWPLRRANLAVLPRAYWFIVTIGMLFALARFSEAFLTLRAMELGLTIGYSPIVIALMSAVYAMTSYPAGRLADRMDRRYLLAIGFVVLILADLLLAGATNIASAMVGIAVWGLHMGLTQGLLSAMIADSAPEHLRGTAFGVFNLVSGLALLLASILAGLLWQTAGASMTFFAGALFSTLALGFLGASYRSIK